MRLHDDVTQKVQENWGADEFICSKTDTNGIITYANEVFCRVAGYAENELLGQSQNIVRHPDMPCVAFAWCWSMLQSGRDWRGIVKNRCKNGDHYWVDATISPQRNAQDHVVGYFAVRRKPSQSDISAVERLYAELCRAEGTLQERKNLSRQAIDALYKRSPFYVTSRHGTAT